jgi:hypothetical protein
MLPGSGSFLNMEPVADAAQSTNQLINHSTIQHIQLIQLIQLITQSAALNYLSRFNCHHVRSTEDIVVPVPTDNLDTNSVHHRHTYQESIEKTIAVYNWRHCARFFHESDCDTYLHRLVRSQRSSTEPRIEIQCRYIIGRNGFVQ